MTHIRSIIMSAAAVAALSAAPAMAQSAFDGGYVGVQGGYDWFSNNAKSTTGGTSSRNGANGNGGEAGIFAGYGQTFELSDMVPGRFYVGAEAEGGFYTGDNTQANAQASTRARPDYSTGVALRLGYLVLPNALTYVKVGYQHTGVDYDVTPVAGTTASDYRSFDGVRAGAGIDYLLTDHLFTRVEYDYTSYGNAGIVTGATNTGFSPQEHQVRLGVGLHF